jgi:DNA transposition AAA+ family ATPase
MTTPQFCETTIARTIRTTLNSVRHLSSNAAMVGPAGVGKTFSLEHYATTVSQTYMLTAGPLSGNAALRLFRQLGETLLGEYAIRGSSLFDIEQRLYRFDFHGHVLIVDEAQNLNLQAIRHLLTLNDHAGLSVVFCGNEEVLNRTTVDKGPFAQIGSRVYFRKRLEAIDDTDADAITNTFGVEGLDAYELMRGVAARHHARGVAFVLRSARELAGKGKTIKAAHIREVFAEFPQYRPLAARREGAIA